MSDSNFTYRRLKRKINVKKSLSSHLIASAGHPNYFIGTLSNTGNCKEMNKLFTHFTIQFIMLHSIKKKHLKMIVQKKNIHKPDVKTKI